MQWSKLKKIIESNFSPSLIGRLSIHTTGYGNSSWGRSWLMLDGEDVAVFSDDEAHQMRGTFLPAHPDHYATRTPARLVEKGEFSSIEFKRACFAFKDMKVDAALASDEILLQFLAVCHKNVGKRRLQMMKNSPLHPLTQFAVDLKLQRPEEPADAGNRQSSDA